MQSLFLKTSFGSIFLVLVSLICYAVSFQLFQEFRLSPTKPAKTTRFQAVLAASSSANTKTFPVSNSLPVNQNDKTVNILLLGLDARIGDARPRCDAIHMVSYFPKTKKIVITSVPRGTRTNMTGVEENSNYISNMCSIQGIPAAVTQIEKITGLEHNYLVKIGFSQAMGLFRLGNLPAVPTLEFLRDRHSYGIGDYQRSYNQATFIKDMIINQTDLAAKMPEPLERLAYQTVDTDLPYDQAKLFFNQFLDSRIYQHPEDISIVIKPADNLTRQDIHLTEQLTQTANWQTDPSFQNYQQELVNQLQTAINQPSRQTLDTIIKQQSWLQIEDLVTRNSLHFQILQALVKSFPDKETAKINVQGFISEMQTSNQEEFILKGQSLLSQLNL